MAGVRIRIPIGEIITIEIVGTIRASSNILEGPPEMVESGEKMIYEREGFMENFMLWQQGPRPRILTRT